MEQLAQQCEQFKTHVTDLKRTISQAIVGHTEVIDELVIALFAGGHVLLEGVPGLGKTLLARSLSQAIDTEFSRIQFTPDLMPADIIGTNIILTAANGTRDFEFRKGPVFTSVLLADEINRATPKTQSALLEAMEEKTVTVSGTSHPLPRPFLVIATQNPLEMEGTYPLPEAQLDRFFFKTLLRASSLVELTEIADRTCGEDETVLKPVLTAHEIVEMKQLARHVLIAPPLSDYAARIVLATSPGSDFATERIIRFVRYGASPRAMQALVVGAKVIALSEERYNVSVDDIRRIARPALRHRVILNFEGEAEAVQVDDLLNDLLNRVND